MRYKGLTKKEPEKKLLLRLKQKAGRGRGGRITVRHRGGGVKRLYRIIDFGQEKLNMPAKVQAIEYDPYRTSFICLLEYGDGDKRYRLCPHGLKVGETVVCGEKEETKTGNRMKLKNIPVGTSVFNIEIATGMGGKLARGAGTAARILNHEGKFTHLISPSSEVKMVSSENFATVGQVSFPEHKFIKIGKAGRKRLKGIRPTVRGSAMVPADHPHGGGEGRTGIGLKYPKTPWGKPALGVKTRKNKWTDKLIVQRRKKR
ncbi:MAG: 50S ribosomal protein L2 [Candidatus Nealsonbacteria bacterium]